MYLNGTWLPNEIKEQAPDIRWGQFAWPAIDAAGDGPEANNYGAQSFGINKDTKYPDEAFAFVRWMTVGEWDQKLADQSMGVPMANDATWPVQIAEAKAVIDATTTRMNWANGMEDDPEINTAIMEGFAKMVAGEFSAQQFADGMAALKR
jgi:raffinose/stachyose/melibiose transport system substrate-binding protein